MFPYTKAIVTGGAGFIGSHIVERLVKLGVETISIDNYSAGKKENLEHLKEYPNFTEVNCDVLDYDKLDELMSGVEVVFHQAASKKTVCMADPRKDLDVNGKGTLTLLELAVKHKVKKFVHASTGSVYGEPRYFPQDEEHPLNPTSYYGVSKLAGEKYVRAFCDLYDLDATILRYFHVYGPRQESSDVGGVVSIFIRRILEGKPITIFGSGEQERSFTYVGDVVNANIAAASVKGIGGEAFNCASGIKVTIKELYDMVCKAMDVPGYPVKYGPWVPGDIIKFDVSNQKLGDILGVHPRKEFCVGLERTVEWGRQYLAEVLGCKSA